MKIYTETDRLILREIIPEDVQGIYLLDSDPEVHRFLGNKPITELRQAEAMIEFIREQYVRLGIGRWAVVEKATDSFVGWSGLKYITDSINGNHNFYDLGYRFLRKFWGKGYATEAARASLEYGFTTLKLKEIYAFADNENHSSCNVLEKTGLQFVEIFSHCGCIHRWYKLSEEEWVREGSREIPNESPAGS